MGPRQWTVRLTLHRLPDVAPAQGLSANTAWLPSWSFWKHRDGRSSENIQEVRPQLGGDGAEDTVKTEPFTCSTGAGLTPTVPEPRRVPGQVGAPHSPSSCQQGPRALGWKPCMRVCLQIYTHRCTPTHRLLYRSPLTRGVCSKTPHGCTAL